MSLLKSLSPVLFLLFTFAIFRPTLSGKFEYIDDHQLLRYLGSDQHLDLHEIPSTILSEREISDPIAFRRFRPTYYTLRVTETWLWQNNATLWYGARIVYFALFLTVVWFGLSQFIGALASALTILVITSFNVWTDIWVRLGPGETYAVPGLAIFLIALINLINNLNPPRKRDLALFIIGACIIAGSKENFVPFALVFAALLWRHFQNSNKHTPASRMAIVLVCIFCVWIFAAIVGSLIYSSGQTFYGESFRIGRTFLLSLIRSTWRVVVLDPISFSVFTFGWLTALAGMVNYFRTHLVATSKPFIGFIKHTRNFWLIQTGSAIFLFANVVFYSNQLPLNNRYDFPAVLIILISGIAAICYGLSLLKPHLPARFNIFTTQELAGWVLSPLLVMLIVVTPNQIKTGFALHRAKSNQRAEYTSAVFNELKALSNIISQTPNAPLIIEAASPQDYEIIESFFWHLRFHNANNPLFLVFTDQEKPTTALEEKLRNEIMLWSLKGNIINLKNQDGIRPLSEFNGGQCYIYPMWGSTKNDRGCQNIRKVV